MTDTVSTAKRSEIMGKIRGRDTKPELLVRQFLHSQGYRFRLHDRKLPCHPDVVLKKYKTVIFVNGCFWHGHSDCKHFKIPKSNVDFWKNKIETNIKRDLDCLERLASMGWKAIIVWECELKPAIKHQTLARIDVMLKKNLKNIGR